MLASLRDALKRPVPWGAVLLTYVGILLALGYTVHVSSDAQNKITMEQKRADAKLAAATATVTHDLCMVVINVHDNAQQRYKIELAQLATTEDYLADPASAESPALRARVRAGLPATKGRVAAAKGNVKATEIPASCKPFVGEKHHAARR